MVKSKRLPGLRSFREWNRDLSARPVSRRGIDGELLPPDESQPLLNAGEAELGARVAQRPD